jgi:hypothetical protein
LALQAHPSFAAVIPGLAVYLLWRGWRFLKGPQIYLAGLVFVAAFSNVLIYNLQSGIGGIRSVNEQYPDKELGTLAYLDTMLAPWHGLLLTVSSSIDPTRAVRGRADSGRIGVPRMAHVGATGPGGRPVHATAAAGARRFRPTPEGTVHHAAGATDLRRDCGAAGAGDRAIRHLAARRGGGDGGGAAWRDAGTIDAV